MATYTDSLLRTGRNTRFSFCDWRIIHRARLDVFPLNATKRWLVGNDKRYVSAVTRRRRTSTTFLFCSDS